MNYLDIFLWVSASCLWLYVVSKIVGSVIDWFDEIKGTKADIKTLHEKINRESKYFDNINEGQWKSINELKARIEKLEKKCKK